MTSVNGLLSNMWQLLTRNNGTQFIDAYMHLKSSMIWSKNIKITKKSEEILCFTLYNLFKIQLKHHPRHQCTPHEQCFKFYHDNHNIPSIHFNDIIMSVMVSQITGLTIVNSTVYSGANQRKHQSSASLAFAWGNHRWPVEMFPFDDVIISKARLDHCTMSAPQPHVYFAVLDANTIYVAL